MNKEEFEKLKELGNFFRRVNGKIKLLSLLRRAKEEYSQNNYSQCMTTCKKILSSDPKNAIALRGLGCVMQSMGNFKQAVKYYKQALEYSENKEIEYTLLGTIYYLNDDLDKAVEYYNMAIDINDGYDPAYEGRNQAMLENHLKIIDLQDQLIKRELF